MKKLLLLFLFSSSIMLSQNDTAKEAPLVVVEQMPVYPGGQGEMVKYIQLNVKYPNEEKKNAIEGICYVTFVVEKDGSISGVRTLRGVAGGPGCDREAERIVREMPRWKPGKQSGREVRVQFNLPIKFTLNEINQDDKNKEKTHH